jgi:hypothetical protein
VRAAAYMSTQPDRLTGQAVSDFTSTASLVRGVSRKCCAARMSPYDISLAGLIKLASALGAVASLLWLVAASYAAFRQLQAPEALPLNAWGDFVAGATAPLAFFWLVLGYLQNTKALREQERALQRQLIESSRIHASLERAISALSRGTPASAQPLKFLNVVEHPAFLGIAMMNVGGAISDLRVMSDGSHEMFVVRPPSDGVIDTTQRSVALLEPNDRLHVCLVEPVTTR